ncbi:MAG: DUF3990 domain-containing protein [Lentisphaeria bacterium]|nr:DUF3990 domain-containing protein [Lentisphaeria bacterium]
MILYHGSNVAVEKPCLIPAKRLLDFGSAFYLTSDLEQAKKWAVRTQAIRECGTPLVSVYEFDDHGLASLRVLTFASPDLDWLHYVVANRTGQPTGQYDLVIGPVANDRAIRTVNDFQEGYFTAEIAIQILRPQKLKDQYAFKSEAALKFLHFKEVLS